MPSATAEGKLKASCAWGAYGGFSHKWCESLSSNIMYSYARVEERFGMPTTSYKYAQYAAANLFWDFSEYGSCLLYTSPVPERGVLQMDRHSSLLAIDACR